MTFTKKCSICGAEFESESRNTKYCSDKCSKRGAKKAYRSRKMKRINARRRGDEKEIEIIIHSAYKLAREVAKMFLYKGCSCEDKDHICSGDLCVHHIDHNPFNNHPSNLRWLCEKAHSELHTHEEDCSVFEEMKAFVTIRKQREIRDRNLKKQTENLEK